MFLPLFCVISICLLKTNQRISYFQNKISGKNHEEHSFNPHFPYCCVVCYKVKTATNRDHFSIVCLFVTTFVNQNMPAIDVYKVRYQASKQTRMHHLMLKFGKKIRGYPHPPPPPPQCQFASDAPVNCQVLTELSSVY